MERTEAETRTDFAVERLLTGDSQSRRLLVRDLAERWPGTRAMALVFTLTDAAAHIEAMLDSETESRQAAFHGYRLAALLAADVYAIELTQGAPVMAQDLWRYWNESDPFFLTG